MKVLVTGASQGIGRAIAEMFLDNGHDVIGLDRQETSLTDGKYVHVLCDVRDELPEIEAVDILVMKNTNYIRIICLVEAFGNKTSQRLFQGNKLNLWKHQLIRWLIIPFE